MPTIIQMPLYPPARPAFGWGLGARLRELPWRRAAMLACVCTALGAALWRVWW